MLVKKEIVEKWYLRDSWVYRNFSYLFVNPLWEKRIPKGFTVCPYFWMSMFSLLIFRPFIVAPLKYIVLPIINAIGKPAHMVDKFMFNIAKSLLRSKADYFKGGGFAMAIAGLLIAAVACIGGCVVIDYAIKAHAALTTTNLGVFTFYSMLSFAVLFSIICIHKLFTKTECKTMYYLVVWAVLFAISAFVFVPTESIAIGGNIASAIGHIFVGIAACGWKLISTVSIFLWTWTKFIFMWKPVDSFVLPWWGYFVGLTVIGWLFDKISCYYDAKQTEYIRKTHPEQIFAAYRSAWIENFVNLMMMNSQWKNGGAWEDEITSGDCCIINAASQFKMTLLRDTFETYWKKELDQLQTDYPTFPKELFEEVKSDNFHTDNRFHLVRKKMVEKYPNFPVMDVDNFIKVFVKEIGKSVAVQNLARFYHEQEAAAIAKAAAKKNSWSHVTCLKVTGNIANTVKSVGRGLKTACVQTGTFFAYLWVLIKAKKQGACPYFQFTDKPKN
jgi:hypothetical protein